MLLASSVAQAQTVESPLGRGQAIELDRVIPANERGILALALDGKGRVLGGTTGRAAHLFLHDPDSNLTRSLVRLEGGIGFAHGLIVLADGSIIGGTQADPTGLARQTNPKAVGKLYRFLIPEQGPARVEDLGVAVPGQGIHTLAWDPKTQIIVGNTWPDGHFFSYDLKERKVIDHGAIAGHRTFETPRHAEDLNRHGTEKVFYPRQVSRAIIVQDGSAWTAGKEGYLHRFDLATRKLEKTPLRLPAVPGREAWASLDVGLLEGGQSKKAGMATLIGGTSDGYFLELRLPGMQLRNRGRPFAQGYFQGLVALPPIAGAEGEGMIQRLVGVVGHPEGMPREFAFWHGGGLSTLVPGGIPLVAGQHSMVGFGAMISDGKGVVWAGEKDRIARLVRYQPGAPPTKKKPIPAQKSPGSGKKTTFDLSQLDALDPDEFTRLKGWVTFAPPDTTTDGSGYTAIALGQDGFIYVGTSRYGGYGWLLRFHPRTRTFFMEKVVCVSQLVSERLVGINTQGKIHALILIGPDGKVWFATKQAHEVFGTRPEYVEELQGYPGGHLCYYDPKTGFSRSVGILKRQEGLMAGAIDRTRHMLYYRSEPKNLFLTYDMKTGAVQERGHVGASCRYMAIDKNGAVYSPGRGPYLSRYDPSTGYIEDLLVKVEGPGEYAAPYVIQLGPNGKLYGAGINHPYIMEFDIASYKPGPFPEVTMRNIAPAAPKGYPVHDIHAGTFGKDGKFYYPLLTHGPVEKGGKPLRHLRIMRFDPETKRTQTAGIPDIELDENKVKHAYVRGTRYELDHIQGAVVSEDGSLFLMDIYPQLNVVCFPQLTAPRK